MEDDMNQQNTMPKWRTMKSVLSAAGMKYFGVVMVVIIAVAGIIGATVFRHNSSDTAVVEEIVSETDIPGSVLSAMNDDIDTAGFYKYDAGSDTYVLLSLGNVANIGLSVTPQIDGTSVHFALSGVEVSDPEVHQVFRVFKTDAVAVSADEKVLENPYYGVGSEGMNVGWVEPTGNGEYYIIPLMDTAPTDRLFKAKAEATLGTGVYYYEYSIQSSGAMITTAEKLDSYSFWASVDRIDNEARTTDILVGDNDVRFNLDTSLLDDTGLSELLKAHDKNIEAKFSVVNASGKASIESITGIVLGEDDERVDTSKTQESTSDADVEQEGGNSDGESSANQGTDSE